MSNSHDEIRLRLRHRLQRAEDLNGAAALYTNLIETLLDVSPAIELPSLSVADVQHKLGAGQPILSGESLGFDAEAVKVTLLQLCEATARFGQSKQESRSFWSRFKKDDAPTDVTNVKSAQRAAAAMQISKALQQGRFDYDALLEQLLTGHDAEIHALAQRAAVDAHLLTTLARFAMRPTMQAFAGAYAEAIVAHKDLWKRPLCPLCGGPPLLSEFNEQAQMRHLRCATCGTGWAFPYLSCARCGSDEHRLLGYFTLEKNAQWRVETCEACHGYIKNLMVNEVTPSALLPLEDLLMLPLDHAAQQKGYHNR